MVIIFKELFNFCIVSSQIEFIDHFKMSTIYYYIMKFITLQHKRNEFVSTMYYYGIRVIPSLIDFKNLISNNLHENEHGILENQGE